MFSFCSEDQILCFIQDDISRNRTLFVYMCIHIAALLHQFHFYRDIQKMLEKTHALAHSLYCIWTRGIYDGIPQPKLNVVVVDVDADAVVTLYFLSFDRERERGRGSKVCLNVHFSRGTARCLNNWIPSNIQHNCPWCFASALKRKEEAAAHT